MTLFNVELSRPIGLKFFEEAEGGKDGGGDDFFADGGVCDGADPGLFKKVESDFQRPGQNVEHLLHFIIYRKIEVFAEG